MTVAELRAALRALPAESDGWTVVLSRDSEGNRFSPLRDVARGFYEAETRGQGQFIAAEDAGVPDPEDWSEPEAALCLWPVR